MYNDNELLECVICSGLGTIANDLYGKKQFFHKVPSKNIQGYFTFTQTHKETN
jgi:hypothetical protein